MQLLGQGKFYYLVDSSKPLDDPDILHIKAGVVHTPDQRRYKSIMEQVTVDTRTGERMWWMRPCSCQPWMQRKQSTWLAAMK